MRNFPFRACFFLGVLCFPLVFSHSQQFDRSPESVWFVLTSESGKSIEIDPVVRVVGKKFVQAPDYCGNSPGSDDFGKKYLSPGQTYSVVFGGARAGQISLKLPKPDESILAAVDYKGTAEIKGKVSALATNAAIDSARKSTRQRPTLSDSRAGLELAKMLFANAGVPANLLSKTKQDDLTWSTLAPDGVPSMVGSFFLPTGGDLDPSHALFFVAKQSKGKLSPELKLVRIAKSQTENESIRFVDQADLFGDGQDSIIAINGYYENYRYRVFGRDYGERGWKQTFETNILGCE